ncbi:NAD(P)-dependent oxidoreductase [Brevibacterium litoralis]|uniref:NAD(P)-dependent oxidoreductase n=1 Tax=Brevibacterium litoralis TaxID=3138935 RepID=UPI0032EE8308
MTDTASPVTALVPSSRHLDLVGDLPAGTQVRTWQDYVDGEVPAESVAFVVLGGKGAMEWRTMLRDLPNLRGVRTVSIGYDWVIDHVPTGVALYNSSAVMSDTTAEHGALLIMASMKSFPEHHVFQQKHEWVPQSHRGKHEHGLMGVVGRTVLVIGQGGIGRGIAERFEAFKAHVVRFARTERTLGDGAHVLPMEQLDEWLPQADAVSLALPLNPSTDGLVDADFLARMKDDAVLGNIGRGKVVDTDALVSELQSGRLRAALDVVDPEPLPEDHPLWDCPGAFITPHAGADSQYMRDNATQDQVDMVLDFLRGDDLGEPVLVKE